MPTTCAFCLAKEVPRHRTVVVYGLQVCDRCNTADLAMRVRRQRQWMLELHEETSPVCHCDVTAWMQKASPVRATFVLESPRTAVRRLLFGELEIDEQAFDDAVFIRTSTPEETTELLRRRSARNAVLELLLQSDGMFRAKVTIDRGKVTARAYGTHPALGHRAQVSCCVVLLALDEMSITGNRGTTPYR